MHEYESLRRVDDATGVTLKIIADPDSESPISEEEDAVIFAVYHNRRINPAAAHGLGDAEAGKAFEAEHAGEGSAYAVFPLFAYEHGNILYKVAESNPFACQWDSGRIGFIALKREDFGPYLLKYAQGIAKSYTDWTNGNVWGYVVEDAEGDTLDSCWGFIGSPEEDGAFTAGLPVWEDCVKDAAEAKADAEQVEADKEASLAALIAAARPFAEPNDTPAAQALKEALEDWERWT